MRDRARIPGNRFAMLRTAVPTMAILSDIIIIINSMQLSTEQQTLSFLSPTLFVCITVGSTNKSQSFYSEFQYS
jgi:hypothetical protein